MTDKCKHPGAALVPMFDFKDGKSVRSGTKCVDCKKVWKTIKRSK